MSPDLTDFDRDTLEVAIKLAREHDATLTDAGAEPVFLADLPRIIRETTGHSQSILWLRLLRLFGQLPKARGRVAGEPFWLRKDIVAWASRHAAAL